VKTQDSEVERDITIVPIIIPTLFGSWNRFAPALWLLFVAFYTVFANVPFWAASYCLGIWGHGWFCLEYAAVGMLALFVPRILAAACLLLAITADLISGLSQTYFLSPSECVTSVSFLQDFSGTRAFTIAAVIVLVLVVTAIATSFPVERIQAANRKRTVACLVAFAVVAASADFITVLRATGHVANLFGGKALNDAFKRNHFMDFRLSRPITSRLIHSEIFYDRIRIGAKNSGANLTTVPSAAAIAVHSEGIMAVKSSQEMPNLVLVLVESWGRDSDSFARNSLVQPYYRQDLLARYDVLEGTVPFYGSTVAGEARELCGSKMGFHILNISAQEAQNCLPARLGSLGYHAIALHGMGGHMFDRLTWYSRLGFHEQWFRDRFRQEGLSDCVGAFTGTCDAAIAEWIGRRLERQETNPDFVYWVTLNSHLPVPITSSLSDGASCSLTPLLSQQPALCSWHQLISNVHRSVSQLAMTKLARPTVFVIVGDHAPPFSNPALRGQFSSTDVPYVILTPRQNGRDHLRPSTLQP
jgi:Sulfatase